MNNNNIYINVDRNYNKIHNHHINNKLSSNLFIFSYFRNESSHLSSHLCNRISWQFSSFKERDGSQMAGQEEVYALSLYPKVLSSFLWVLVHALNLPATAPLGLLPKKYVASFLFSLRFPWNLSMRQCGRKWEIKLPGSLSAQCLFAVSRIERLHCFYAVRQESGQAFPRAKNITWRGKRGLLTPALRTKILTWAHLLWVGSHHQSFVRRGRFHCRSFILG